MYLFAGLPPGPIANPGAESLRAVVESDESDGSFVKLPATIAIVTNMDPEHLDFYGDFDAERDAFQTFIDNLPFYGFGALCIDHPEVQALIGRISDRRIITYGFSPQADIRGLNLDLKPDHSGFDVALSERLPGGARRIDGFRLPMPGAHNVQNALSAIVVGLELGFDDDTLRQGIAAFGGVKRRFTRTGEAGGITVIDDYGHHPVEIAAVLKAARQACEGRVIAVHQPHRYSRLHSLFDDFCACFNEADVVAIAEVYAAGEEPIEGASRDDLVAGLIRHGHRHARAISTEDDLVALVAEQAQEGDMVVCLGAGTISAWANNLPKRLAK